MKSKYGNKKVEVKVGNELIKFDSMAEAKRGLYLYSFLEAGTITDLVFQPSFELQAKFKRGGETIRAITYIADFSYILDEELHVEDVKGMLTNIYQMKKKLFLKKFGSDLRFYEAYFKRNKWEIKEI